MMTKKDFQLIADVLEWYGWILEDFEQDNYHMLVDYFAETLKQTNPRFDKEKFKKAATYTKEDHE